jgi:hypothetical protein
MHEHLHTALEVISGGALTAFVLHAILCPVHWAGALGLYGIFRKCRKIRHCQGCEGHED